MSARTKTSIILSKPLSRALSSLCVFYMYIRLMPQHILLLRKLLHAVVNMRNEPCIVRVPNCNVCKLFRFQLFKIYINETHQFYFYVLYSPASNFSKYKVGGNGECSGYQSELLILKTSQKSKRKKYFSDLSD